MNAHEIGSVRTDDALVMSREGAITRLAYSCLLIVGIHGGWLGPLIPQISRTAHVPIESAGLIVSAASAGYFASLLIAGEINQRLSAQKVLVGGMLLFTAGLAGLAVARSLAGLLGAGVLIGLACGGIDIGANTLIVELNRERTASALNYLHVLFGIGALAGPLIVSVAFATHVSYWWIFVGGAIASAMIAYRLSTAAAIEVQTEPTAGEGFVAMLSRPIIWAIGAVLFLFEAAEIGIGTWLFLYLRTAGALSPMLASSGVSIYWLGLVCGRFSGGRIGHRIAIPLFTILSCALSALALIILILAPTHGVLAASAMFLIGFGFGPIFPNMIAAGAARFPSEVGRMTSIVVAGAALGGIVGPWIMGVAITTMSARASMEVALAATLAMGAITIALRGSDSRTQELNFL